MVPTKRSLNNKPIRVKCKAVNNLEKEMINKDVAAKYGVPKNTLSAWVKNKYKLATSLEKKGMSSSRKRTHCGNSFVFASKHWRVTNRFQRLVFSKQ